MPARSTASDGSAQLRSVVVLGLFRELDFRVRQALVEHLGGRLAHMEPVIFFRFPSVDHHPHTFKADDEVVRLAVELHADAVPWTEAGRGYLLVSLFHALLEGRDHLRARLFFQLRLAQQFPAVEIRVALRRGCARVQGIEFERLGLLESLLELIGNGVVAGADQSAH